LIQGDRVPASKLGQCREDSATPAQQLCKRYDAEWEAKIMQCVTHITQDRGIVIVIYEFIERHSRHIYGYHQ